MPASGAGLTHPRACDVFGSPACVLPPIAMQPAGVLQTGCIKEGMSALSRPCEMGVKNVLTAAGKPKKRLLGQWKINWARLGVMIYLSAS